MPPLTLEQVLARSMRLPHQRTQGYISKLYHGSGAGAANAIAGELTEPGFFQLSHSDLPTSRGSRTKLAALKTPARQEKLNFFELMEREDVSRWAGRLSIHRSDHLVHNSADLTTFLAAAVRTGDWQDGLKVFAEVTALPAFNRLLHNYAPAELGLHKASVEEGGVVHPAPGSSVSLSGVTPNAGHVMALLDMCANAGQYQLMKRIGAFFAPAFPEAFVRSVELLAARAAASSLPTSVSSTAAAPTEPLQGWQAAFAYLTTQCLLPAADIPVEAFNVCLRGCEAARDWRGALRVVRAMGPNPLQGWRAAEEEDIGELVRNESRNTVSSCSHKDDEALAATVTHKPSSPSEAATATTPTKEAAGSDATTASTSAPPLSTPPSPNVVSYATLIATLEQAGKDHIASAVLNRLPAVEKEEITASYAALIFVWSNQVLHKHRRRF